MTDYTHARWSLVCALTVLCGTCAYYQTKRVECVTACVKTAAGTQVVGAGFAAQGLCDRACE